MTRRILGLLEALLFALAVLSMLAAHWIEALTGLDPDAGSGALEWLLSVALVALGLLCRWLRTRRPARV